MAPLDPSQHLSLKCPAGCSTELHVHRLHASHKRRLALDLLAERFGVPSAILGLAGEHRLQLLDLSRVQHRNGFGDLGLLDFK